MARLVLPAMSILVAGDLAAGVKPPVGDPSAVVMMMMMLDHDDLSPRPVKRAEVESRRDPVGRAPEKAHAPDKADRMVPADGRVMRPAPTAIDDDRIVVRQVDDASARRFDIDMPSFPHHPNVIITAEMAVRIGLLAETLDGPDDLLFLEQECVAEPVCPVDVLIQTVEKLRERHQGHHARVPIHAANRFDGVLASQARIGSGPARGLHHLQGIGCRDQNVRKHGVGVQRDRCQHLVEFGLREPGLIIAARGRLDNQAEHEKNGEKRGMANIHTDASLGGPIGHSDTLFTRGSLKPG